MQKHREAKLNETLPLSGSVNQSIFIPKNRQPIKRYIKMKKKKKAKKSEPRAEKKKEVTK